MLLYTLGSNDYSELTYDPEDSQALIPQKLENFIGQDITKIAYGFFHTLILVNNMVFSFGKTKDGALGRVDRGKEILKIDGLNDIVDISCGETHSAALGINGDLYAWGRFRNLDYKTMKITQNCLRHEPLKIADNVSKMASCNNSIILQKDNGEVFYYGGLNIYKYALEKESSKKLKLKKIKGASDSIPVFDYIKASGDEFFGVKNNEIFAFGKSIYDYLFKKSAPTLESVKFNSKKFKYIYLEKVDDNNEICKVIVKIKSCNFDRFQSLFLSKKRKLYIKGRMITHKINDTFKTKNYKFLSKIMINVDYIACNSDAYLCVTNNELYMWGIDKYGVLGHHGKVINEPSKIDFQFNKIVGIYAGENYIMVLTEDDIINNQNKILPSESTHLVKGKLGHTPAKEG